MRLSGLVASVVLCTLPLACGSIAIAQAQSGDPLVIVKGGRYGFIDRSGTMIIPPLFLWAEGFDEGMSSAYVCGKMISIDSAGQPHPLRAAKKGELGPKKVGQKYALVNSYDQLATQAIYDDVGYWSDGAMPVKRNGKWGYVEEHAQEVIPPKFDEAFPFMSGVANAELDGESLIINKRGEIIYRGAHFLQGVDDQRIAMRNDEGKAGFFGFNREGRNSVHLRFGWCLCGRTGAGK